MASELQNPLAVGYGQKLGGMIGQEFFSDDPLVLPVSVYLESSEDSNEILADAIELARAYGFTDISTVETAPGSFFGRFTAKFHNKDHHAAKRSKKELKTDLRSKKPPKNPKKAKAVKKIHDSFLKRAKKNTGTMLLMGVSFLGGFAGNVTYDLAKDYAKAEIIAAAPKVGHGIDTFAYKELPPAEAAKVHGVVSFFITQSPKKAEHAPPPPAPGEE